jgi:hypothetical protein
MAVVLTFWNLGPAVLRGDASETRDLARDAPPCGSEVSLHQRSHAWTTAREVGPDIPGFTVDSLHAAQYTLTTSPYIIMVWKSFDCEWRRRTTRSTGQFGLVWADRLKPQNDECTVRELYGPVRRNEGTMREE